MKRNILLLACAAFLPLLAGCHAANAHGSPKIETPTLVETGAAASAAIIKTVPPLPPVATEAENEQPLLTIPAFQSSTLAVPSGLIDPQVQRAVDDLASRLKLDAGQVRVAAVIGQDFSLQGFSCKAIKERTGREAPEQNITGRTILLEAAGRRFEYHAGKDTVFFCRSIN